MSELSARDGMIMGALDGAECVARLAVGACLAPPVDPSRPPSKCRAPPPSQQSSPRRSELDGPDGHGVTTGFVLPLALSSLRTLRTLRTLRLLTTVTPLLSN